MRKHWTDGLWKRTKNLLDQAGIKSLTQLAATSEWELLRHKGLGRKTIKQLEDMLRERGLKFKTRPRTLNPLDVLPGWLPDPPSGAQWKADHERRLGLTRPWGNRRMLPLTVDDYNQLKEEADILRTLCEAFVRARELGLL